MLKLDKGSRHSALPPTACVLHHMYYLERWSLASLKIPSRPCNPQVSIKILFPSPANHSSSTGPSWAVDRQDIPVPVFTPSYNFPTWYHSSSLFPLGEKLISIFLAFPPYMAPGRPPFSDFWDLCWRSLMASASKSKVSSSHLTLQRTEVSIPPSSLRSQIHSFIFLFPCSILSWLTLHLTSSWVTVDATQSVILSLLHFHTRTSLYTEPCP